MKKFFLLLFILFLCFSQFIFAQDTNSLEFRVFNLNGEPLNGCEVYINGKFDNYTDPLGRYIFKYGNETKQLKFELIDTSTGLRKKFNVNIKDGKNNLPGYRLIMSNLYTFIRLEDENYDIKKIFDILDSARVTDLFVETFYNGKTIYPSSIKGIGRHGNKDYLQEVLDEGHKRGIRIHAWIHTLYWYNLKINDALSINKDILMLNRNGKPDQGDEPNYLFVSPSNPFVINTLTQLIEEIVKRYPTLYGINFDYIRFKSGIASPENLATHDYGYENTTKDLFYNSYKLNPDKITIDTSETSDWMKWITFKEDIVTNLLVKLAGKAKINNPDIHVTADVFPEYINQRGYNLKCQYWKDFATYGKLDDLMQMCYGVNSYTDEIKSLRDYFSVSLVVIALSGKSKHDPLSKQLRALEEFNLTTEFGIWYFSDLKNKENQKILREVIFR